MTNFLLFYSTFVEAEEDYYKLFPIANKVFSSPCAAVNWRPTGNPSTVPTGIEIAGLPVKLAGTVKASARYADRGSDFSPINQAGVGMVGVSITSTDLKASSNSLRNCARAAVAFP